MLLGGIYLSILSQLINTMKGIFFILLVFVSLKAENVAAAAAAGKNEDVYIVYMGAAASTNGLRNDHSQLLSSLR